MNINKSQNLIARIWASYTDETGNAANPDTSAKITIYPANSNTPTVAQTDMTNFATGIYYYAIDATNMMPGQYTVRFTFVDNGITQEYLQNLDIYVNALTGCDGGISQPLIIKDVNGDGAKNAKVEVFSSASMSTATKLSGNLFTDDVGQITINLNAGTYYLRVTNRGQTFASPITITVAA